jgi:hypothetical protein
MAVIGLGVDLENVVALIIRRGGRNKSSSLPSEPNRGKAMTAGMSWGLQVAKEKDVLMPTHAVITYTDC